LEDIEYQHKNALAALNDQLRTAKRDSQQLKYQLDDALRRAADERQRSASAFAQMLSSSLNILFRLFNCSCSEHKHSLVMSLPPIV